MIRADKLVVVVVPLCTYRQMADADALQALLQSLYATLQPSFTPYMVSCAQSMLFQSQTLCHPPARTLCLSEKEYIQRL